MRNKKINELSSYENSKIVFEKYYEIINGVYDEN
jgi:hypothetical protein